MTDSNVEDISDRLRVHAQKLRTDAEISEVAAAEIARLKGDIAKLFNAHNDAQRFKCDHAKAKRAYHEAEGTFETEDFHFAIEMALQYGAAHVDDDATVLQISDRDLYVIMKVLGWSRKTEAGQAISYDTMLDAIDIAPGTPKERLASYRARVAEGAHSECLVGPVTPAEKVEFQEILFRALRSWEDPPAKWVAMHDRLVGVPAVATRPVGGVA